MPSDRKDAQTRNSSNLNQFSDRAATAITSLIADTSLLCQVRVVFRLLPPSLLLVWVCQKTSCLDVQNRIPAFPFQAASGWGQKLGASTKHGLLTNSKILQCTHGVCCCKRAHNSYRPSEKLSSGLLSVADAIDGHSINVTIVLSNAR